MLNTIINKNKLNLFNYKFLNDNIIIIYDFINNDEQNELLQIAKMSDINNWQFSAEKLSKYLVVNNFSITKKITDRLQSILQDQSLTTTGFYTMHKFEINDMMPEHIDYGDLYGNLVQGGVLYLNDEFSGGELLYTDLGIEVKPVSKSLLVHTAEEPHMVKKILFGTRYSMPFFVLKDVSILSN